MMLKQKLVRPAVVVLAGVVVILTFAVVVNAIQTITTANATLISYNLASNASSAPITVPVANQPVLVMGTTITLGDRGVGQVSLLSIPGAFLEWVGLDSTAGATITQGFSGVLATKILFLDFAHSVRIEVVNPTQFRVRNLAAAARAGNVKMIW